jgi:hypothetical protein
MNRNTLKCADKFPSSKEITIDGIVVSCYFRTQGLVKVFVWIDMMESI